MMSMILMHHVRPFNFALQGELIVDDASEQRTNNNIRVHKKFIQRY